MSNFNKDINAFNAMKYAEALKKGHNVHFLLYGLFTSRVTKEALEGSNLQRELGSYADHVRYGPMAKKIISRFDGITKGFKDPLNALMEAQYGLKTEKSESNPGHMMDKKSVQASAIKQENPILDTPAINLMLSPAKEINIYQRNASSRKRKIAFSTSHLTEEKSPAASSSSTQELVPPPKRDVILSVPNMWATASRQEAPKEIPRMHSGRVQKRSPQKQHTDRWYKREQWSPKKTYYRSTYRRH